MTSLWQHSYVGPAMQVSFPQLLACRCYYHFSCHHHGHNHIHNCLSWRYYRWCHKSITILAALAQAQPLLRYVSPVGHCGLSMAAATTGACVSRTCDAACAAPATPTCLRKHTWRKQRKEGKNRLSRKFQDVRNIIASSTWCLPRCPDKNLDRGRWRVISRDGFWKVSFQGMKWGNWGKG